MRLAGDSARQNCRSHRWEAMNILQRFAQDPEGGRDTFRDACLGWVSSTLEHIRLRGADAIPVALATELKDAVVRSTMLELDARMAAIVEAGRPSGRRRSPLEVLTSGYVTERQATDRLTAFKSFVCAMTCYHLLQLLTDAQERRQVTVLLLMALGVPIEEQELAQASRRAAESFEDMVPDRVVERLQSKWSKTAPETFGKVVAVARKDAGWAHGDVRRRLQPSNRPVRRDAAQSLSDAELQARDLLLAALYSVSCQVAKDVGSISPGGLLLWLILGGVSHTRLARERKEALPYLVQPALIDAVEELFGKNFIRSRYRGPVSKAFDAAKRDYWEQGKNTFLAILQLDLAPEQVDEVAEFLGDCPRSGLAQIACAVQAVLPHGGARQRQAGEGDDGREGVPPPDDWLGWNLFLAVGERTFRRLLAEGRQPAEACCAELRSDPEPPQAAFAAFDFDAKGEPPPEHQVAGAAKSLCDLATKVNWKRLIEAYGRRSPV